MNAERAGRGSVGLPLPGGFLLELEPYGSETLVESPLVVMVKVPEAEEV
jgi:hypothetical protein